MAATTTVEVPHLGGIKAGYRLSNGAVDPTKPTVVLINSMCTTSALYNDQFDSKTLTDAANLLAIEPLGHGATSCAVDHFTYWDSAIMALQVMDKLGVSKAFALGTSQGGWVVVRMALLAPDRILGLFTLGTSMDSESEESRAKGAWNPHAQLGSFYEKWCSLEPTPDFVIDDVWCGAVGSLGFGTAVSPETIQFWVRTVKSVYVGDEGRRKVKGALLNLMERDSLLLRLRDIRCPVYWLQGTDDVVYGVQIPKDQIELFTGAKEKKVRYLEQGGHYLNATNPKEVEEEILEMINKYN
ncbi:alpha beta hydrolase fold family [Grosmannia clavigera kw1407]|uniref:Alpha beta hydrolase fold family n=1 Tax=Grosmannia clavigera (strain kw1407 / UAMH 11150) TaxID=655863 RepID=F0X906_GROCL|nr:alpha beta hydrolase fold family [Grosmannia clavigera kw1407]EFX05414.1 alpha beta hydrolase fold family [Grosmannia clavigera kw1407]